MLASKSVSQIYEFGPFRLDAATSQLFSNGQPVPLEPKVFQTLLILVRNWGRLVDRDELMGEIWPDSFVEDTNLARNISILRKILRKAEDGSRYIETIPKRGYRFVGNVRKPEFSDSDNAGGPIPPQGEPKTGSKDNLRNWKLRAATPTQSEHQGPKTPSRGLLVLRDSLVATQDRLNKHSKLALGFVAIALTAVGVGATLYLRQKVARPANALGSIRSIAVLPFKQLGGEEPDQYLGLGLADALITRLGNLRQIKVRPTAAVQRLASDEADPGAIGRTLGVDAVLDGLVQRQGDTVRVTVQLVSAKDGSPIWAEKFDEPFNSIFAAQDAVAMRVAHKLVPVLAPGEPETRPRRDTASTEAYEAYLKGRLFWNKRTTESFRKSIDYFKQAIQKDPSFALAYVGLADAYSMNFVPEAEPTLRKALELDDTLGEAHASLGFYKTFWQWDWPGAEQEFKQAIELSPNYPPAHQWYASLLAELGRVDQAKQEMVLALEIDPLSPNLNADMGQMCYFARQYDEAISFCRRALEVDPEFVPAHQYLSCVYMKKGAHAEAVQEYLKAHDPNGLEPWKSAYDRSGWSGFLQSLINTNHVSTSANIHLQAGNKKAALDDLERCDAGGWLTFSFIKVEPLYDDIRAEQRFQNLLKRIGLGS